MKIREGNNGVVLEEADDFSIEQTFDCGQCFRFNKNKDGSYTGVAFGKAVTFKEKNKNIIIENITMKEYKDTWHRFLDLDRDYKEIKSYLLKDEVLKNAIMYGNGIRILKQDFSECVISFIISQQNNIPKIKKAIAEFCKTFGKEIKYNNASFYTFPSIYDLMNITKNDLQHLKIGYRDEYIIDAIKKIGAGDIEYNELNKLSYIDAKEKLKKIKGVGDKVADCILLFSLGKFEAFPVDTWIKKAMKNLYDLKETEINYFTSLNFKEYSGFAQQYLFYYIRNMQKKGT